MAKGKKTGGRKKGSRNKAPSKAAIVAQAIGVAAADGIMPLDYMLGVVRDAKADPGRRDDMAKAAAPYCHAKLASIEHTGKDGAPLIPRDYIIELVRPARHDG